jgi:phosphoserine phosphatase RsbU/P
MPEIVKPRARPLESTEILTLLSEVSERINSTLDFDELMVRIAEVVKRAADYEVLAIFLLNEKTQELRVRFSVGHPDDIVRNLRIKVGQGIVGRAAQERRSVLVNDVRGDPTYIQSLASMRSELAVPLVNKNRVVGVVDLEAPCPDFFTARHQNLIELLAGRIAVSIENAALYRRSVRQARTLQLLNEISRELSSVLVLNELLRKIGTLTRRLINYHRFGILFADERTQTFNTVISIKQDENMPEKTTVAFGQGIVGAAVASQQIVVVSDVSKDPRYIFVNPETRSEMAVPLLHRERVIGVVDLESPKLGYFTDEHVRVFSTLAPQIAIAIENARLYERVVRSEARLERDLERAREIQIHMMPGLSPSVPGLEVAIRFQPARELGGDLYDFFAYGRDRHVLAVGDVSGKGAPAALYGAMVSGILRSLAPQRLSATDMLRKLNVSLLERKIDGHFVTLLYCVWEPRTRVLRLGNAGMPLPILVRRGQNYAIHAEGVPLGLLEHTEYEETSLTLEKGDLLAMSSDGILEAMNPQNEEFGARRLESVLRENAQKPVAQIVERIFVDVVRHEHSEPRRDDQTLVLVRAR